jgi:hypothetical protein
MQPSRLSTINKRSRHVRSPSSPVDIDEDPLTPTDMSYQRALTPTRPKTNIFGDPNRSSDNCTRILYVIIGLICIAIVGVIVLVIQMMSGDDRSANIQIHNEQVHQPEQQQQQQQHLPQLHHNHHHEPQQHQQHQHRINGMTIVEQTQPLTLPSTSTDEDEEGENERQPTQVGLTTRRDLPSVSTVENTDLYYAFLQSIQK